MNQTTEKLDQAKVEQLAEEIAHYAVETGAHQVEGSIGWKTLDEVNPEAANEVRYAVEYFLTDEAVYELVDRVRDAIVEAQEGGSENDA